MKIESMTATFGKLEGQTLELKPGLNVITAPNEWGKSTWCAFLLAMLYGVDTKSKSTKGNLADKERYAPWSGSPMSGRMEIQWEGRRITLERTTRGRIPMGQFRAWETESGLAVPELTAANCGERLLGVERSVFRRAGFIRLSDLPVTQDEALRRRLNALVTTGDESGDAALLQKGLRELKNRCRYNRSGLLPQAQQERTALLGKLDALRQAQEECRGIAEKIEENAAAQTALQNHEAALAYQDALRDRERVDAAVRVQEQSQRRLDAAEEACRDLPCAQEAQEKQQALDALWQQLMDFRQLPQPLPPAPPREDGCFAGKSAKQVHCQLAEDIAAYQNRKPLLLWLLAALLAAAAAGICAWQKQYVITAVSAGILLLSLIFLMIFAAGGGKARRALTRRYGSPSPEDWQRQADDYLRSLVLYRQQEEAYQQNAAELARRRELLHRQVREACGGQNLEQCRRQWQQIGSAWQALAAAQEDASQAKRQYETLKEMARPLPPEPRADSRTETAEETAAALQELRRQEQLLRSADGRCRGQMTALGQEDELRSRLARLEQRIAALERYEAALELAQQTLAQATSVLQRRFAPRITGQAQQYLSRLTLGKYDRLRLDDDLTLRSGSTQDAALREALWRSEGTVDQLYLALRLAVAQALTPEAPLILDDALARFDDARLDAAMSLLQELAAERQIILFTCQAREEKHIAR